MRRFALISFIAAAAIPATLAGCGTSPVSVTGSPAVSMNQRQAGHISAKDQGGLTEDELYARVGAALAARFHGKVTALHVDEPAEDEGFFGTVVSGGQSPIAFDVDGTYDPDTGKIASIDSVKKSVSNR